jgi:hypothetical protein
VGGTISFYALRTEKEELVGTCTGLLSGKQVNPLLALKAAPRKESLLISLPGEKFDTQLPQKKVIRSLAF